MSFLSKPSLAWPAFVVAFALQATSIQPASSKEIIVGPELQKYTVEEIVAAYKDKPMPEGVKMYLSIQRGERMQDGDGWFGPAQARHDWKWLADRHGVAPDGAIAKDKFQGRPEWFERLDRNKDGKLTGDEFDWSSRNPWVQQSYMINRFFRKIDRSGDGQMTREEWLAFFDQAAGGKSTMTSDDLRDAWLSGGVAAGFLPGDAPTKEMLLKGLFDGEVGSLQEGPALDAAAPDFKLSTADGEKTIQLSKQIGSKPIVLCFGNFTCGPFRSMYPAVDEIAQRYKDQATFLAVYVREAHPIDGWAMQSNARVGIEVAQPKDYAQRCSVAGRCQKLLQPSIPLLVDEMNDPVGNAYSGMPARLYVIDTKGKVAYKGGRGPFGFKAREMEQALIMQLMDQPAKPAAAGK